MKINKATSKEQAFKRWPSKCANERIQEKDGIFFQAFESAVKQQNDAFSSDPAQLCKDLKPDEPLPSDSQLGLQDAYDPPTETQLETLYVESLYTIKHRIGATAQSHLAGEREIYEYLQKAFCVTPLQHQKLLARVNKEKPPKVVLDVTVVEARKLEAKDADGFSDPYCMLGIVAAKNGTSSKLGTSSSNGLSAAPVTRGSQRRKTPLDVIPAKYIKTTTVKDNTLSPVWNEKFRFDLDDVSSDKLHLDIWDHDDDTSVIDSAKRLNEVKGLKGLGRYFKQIAQSARTSSDQVQDDFLGSVDITLVDIPSTGLDQWYDLKGRTSKSSVEGSVHLRLNLATTEDRGLSEDEELFEIREHRDLISAFIRYENFLSKESGSKWRGELSSAARTVLHQHAIQGDLSELQQVLCYWLAFEQQFCYKPFDWLVLLRYLQDLTSKWESGVLYREEESALSKSYDHFTRYCVSLIEAQRQYLTLSNDTSRHQFNSMMKCLTTMHSSSSFKHCCPFSKDLKYEVVGAVKKAVTNYYKHLQDIRRSADMREENFTLGYIRMVTKLVRDALCALYLYTPALESLSDFSYFHTYYKQSRRLLAADLKQDLENLEQMSPDVDLHSLNFHKESKQGAQIMTLLNSLIQYKALENHLPSGCDKSEIGKLELQSYFEPYILRWIHIIQLLVPQRVLLAIQLDKVEVTEEKSEQSSSAVDVAYTFGQISEFWLNLRWWEIEDPSLHLAAITEVICSAALLYANLMHDKLRAAGYYDEIGQFDITQQLCVTINNIEQVRRALAPVPECLRFDEDVKQTDDESHSVTLTSLYDQISSTDTQIVNKIKQISDRVAERMRPDIKKFVAHLCWAPEKAQSIDVIDRLMNYLDSNLTMLNTNVLRTNFERILESIWSQLLHEIYEVISSKDQDLRSAHWISSRLAESLEILVDFFHAGGKGLQSSAILCSLYTILGLKGGFFIRFWRMTLRHSVQRFFCKCILSILLYCEKISWLRWYESNTKPVHDWFQNSKEIFMQLKLRNMSASELMEEFYVDRIMGQQETKSSKHGSLSVRVYFNNDASLLNVEVLQAKNLLPMDTNGLSDPYVIVQLCPGHVFTYDSSAQTKVINRSLNPQFNDSFEFQVTEDQCLVPGACVQFTVMDHDVLTANDFAGEAYLPLSTVPGVGRGKRPGQSALTPYTLHLMNPQGGDGSSTASIISAMSLRADKPELVEFVRQRKNLYTTNSD